MTTTAGAGAPRPDSSMDLLNDLYRTALDPGYERAAGSTEGPSRRHWTVLAVMAAFGTMAGLGMAATLESAPAVSTERQQLIARVRAGEAGLDALRDRAATLADGNAVLEAAAGGTDPAAQARLDSLGVATGAVGVTGPGVVLRLDDGADASRTGSKVVDVDLRVAVNSLWKSGAEAVAVNGHRLSARTAIRGAGDAITVDYRSLIGPYVVEAIGDPAELDTRFRASPGAAWWAALRDTFKMRFEIARVQEITLPSDRGLAVTLAESADKGE